MTKSEAIRSMSREAKARKPLPPRDTGDHVTVRWPKYRKAVIYEGHPLPNTYDAHAHLSMERGTTVQPKGLPDGYHDPRDAKLDSEEWHKGSKPVTVIPLGLDRSLATQRVRRMKPKAKQKPKAKAVLGTAEWDVQYRPDLPANWAEQARKRNWDCVSRHLGAERPTVRKAIRLLTQWRMLDSRMIVDIDDKRRVREVWFKTPPVKTPPKLGRIADDGISGR